MALWEREAGAAVYVTHNLDEAVRLADRVVVLSRRPGRIKEIIPVRDPPARARRAPPCGRARGHPSPALVAHPRRGRGGRQGARGMTDAPASPGRARRALPRRRLRAGLARLDRRPRLRRAVRALGSRAHAALGQPILLPGPIEVGAAFSRLVASGEMGRHLAASLGRRIGAGFAIGAAAGIVLGAGIALFTATRSIGIPLVSALFPIPKRSRSCRSSSSGSASARPPRSRPSRSASSSPWRSPPTAPSTTCRAT